MKIIVLRMSAVAGLACVVAACGAPGARMNQLGKPVTNSTGNPLAEPVANPIANSAANPPSKLVAQPPAVASPADTPTTPDPYLWLEEVESTRALDYVKGLNKKSQSVLETDARFLSLKDSLKKIMSLNDRIPAVSLQGEYVYNFWQDETHVRGIWRRAKVAEFNSTQGNPVWETILNIDKLAKDENENWIMKWNSCSQPDMAYCLIGRSRGGKDAVVQREFSIATKSFVEGGFSIPEGKNSSDWIDANTLIVTADLGPDTVTDSGYPRQVRIWKRGTALAQAPIVLEVPKTHVSTGSWVVTTPEGQDVFATTSVDFFNQKYNRVNADGSLVPLAFPEGSNLETVYQGQYIVSLRKELVLANRPIKAGSVVAYKKSDNADLGTPEILFEPSEKVFLSGVTRSGDSLLLTLLDNVSSKIVALRKQDSSWTRTEIPVAPFGSASVKSASAFTNNFYLGYESFLVPPNLQFAQAKEAKPAKGKPAIAVPTYETTEIKRLAPKYNSEGFTAQQIDSVS